MEVFATFEAVAQAATELVAEGCKPTCAAVHTKLNRRGSQNTIAKHLRAWKTALALRDGKIPAPDTVKYLIAELHEACADAEHARARQAENQSLKAQLAWTEDQLATATARQQQLESENQQVTDAFEHLKNASGEETNRLRHALQAANAAAEFHRQESEKRALRNAELEAQMHSANNAKPSKTNAISEKLGSLGKWLSD